MVLAVDLVEGARQHFGLDGLRHDDDAIGIAEDEVTGLNADAIDDDGDIDGLDLADVAEDGVQLAGETVQLILGQREAGQARQVGYLVSRDLRDDSEA